MPSSSQAKKEEAELRKIAKNSRLVRKEAAVRARKQKKQQQKRRGADADADSSTRRFKPKGAVILPEEISELQRRLFTNSAADDNKKAGSPAKQGKTKKGGKQKLQKTKGKTEERSDEFILSRPEPPYSVEVHHKKKEVHVDVTLHHIPPAHIDISETSQTKLVVDTGKHTKKFRLEFPMPEGICVDVERAEFELDGGCGVLRCVLPILGDIPNTLVQEREKMLETIRQQKTLRFRVGADGGLKVRSRQALLAQNPREQAALAEQRKKAKKRSRDENDDDDKNDDNNNNDNKKDGEGEAEEGVGAEEKTNTANENDSATTNRAKKVQKTEKTKAAATLSHSTDANRNNTNNNNNNKNNKNNTNKTATTATPPPPPKQKSEPKKTENRRDVFAEEHQRALQLARAAGRAAQGTLRDGIARAKALQQKRLERLSSRVERREVRTEKTQDSFARVLEEQRRQLRMRADLAATAAAAAENRAANRKNSGKSVSFAIDANK